MKKKFNYHYIKKTFSNHIQEEIDSLKKYTFTIVLDLKNFEYNNFEKISMSLKDQWIKNFNLIIINESISSIKNLFNEFNPTIIEKNEKTFKTYNKIIEDQTSDYILFLKEYELIENSFFYELLKIINHKEYNLIYTNEALIKNNNFINVKYKSNLSKELIYNFNYIGKSLIFKTSFLKNINGFENYNSDESLFYDLILRTIESTNEIYFLDLILFHQNLDLKENEINENNLVLENMLKRRKIEVKIKEGIIKNSFKLEYPIKNNPLVSIIIPFKDQPKLLQTCIDSILNLSTYNNFEIIGISNNSIEKETIKQMNIFEQKDSRIKFIEYNVPFNYSHINNYAVKNYSNGEHIIFLNNDIEIISPDWIEALLQYSQQDKIGCVGAKLLYPNNTIQHCGIKVGGENVAQHFLAHLKVENPGYENRESLVQNVTAVTAACMMIKKTLFEEIDYFDEKLTVAYNDVDLCLKAIKKDKLNIFTPYCKAYHYESISRGSDKNGKKLERLLKEQAILKEKNKDILENEDLYITDNIFNQMQLEIHDIKNKSLLKKIRIYSKPIREKIKKFIKRSK